MSLYRDSQAHSSEQSQVEHEAQCHAYQCKVQSFSKSCSGMLRATGKRRSKQPPQQHGEKGYQADGNDPG